LLDKARPERQAKPIMIDPFRLTGLLLPPRRADRLLLVNLGTTDTPMRPASRLSKVFLSTRA